jgi:thiosulfate reductase cytochrome b subunit
LSAAVGFYDWMLALHVLSAAAMGVSLVVFTMLVVTGRRLQSIEEAELNFRLGGIGGIVIGIGAVAALILGIVLAIDSEAYHPWDGWVIAAIVLWAVLGAIGGRAGRYYTETQRIASDGRGDEALARLRAPIGPTLVLVSDAIFAVILLDMLFKPGA